MAAVDTAVTPKSGAAALGQKLQVLQAKINFANTNLAVADWFQVLNIEAGDIVIGGALTVLTPCTATAKVAIATSSALLAATLVDTAAGTTTPFSNTAGIGTGAADTVDVTGSVAAIETGEILVTAVVLKSQDFEG